MDPFNPLGVPELQDATVWEVRCLTSIVALRPNEVRKYE
jgi:hypothetical protein